MLWLLGLLVLALVVASVILLRRRRPPKSLQAALAVTTTLRDRLAQEVAGPSAATSDLQRLVDEADTALRAAQTDGPSSAAGSALERSLSAVAEVRSALALGGAAAGAAHARGADVESALLRSLASLDAALGPLRAAAGREVSTPGPDATGGFES